MALCCCASCFVVMSTKHARLWALVDWTLKEFCVFFDVVTALTDVLWSCAVLIDDAEEILRVVKEEGDLRAAQFAELDPLVAEEAVRGVNLGGLLILRTPIFVPYVHL